MHERYSSSLYYDMMVHTLAHHAVPTLSNRRFRQGRTLFSGQGRAVPQAPLQTLSSMRAKVEPGLGHYMYVRAG